GITPAEAAALETHVDLWIRRIMRIEPIDRAKIIPAIEGLYEAAGLRKPRVVIAPSPLVANIAGGLSAAIWHLRKHATGDATGAATFAATYDATHAATDAATRDATYAATYAATHDAASVAACVASYV